MRCHQWIVFPIKHSSIIQYEEIVIFLDNIFVSIVITIRAEVVMLASYFQYCLKHIRRDRTRIYHTQKYCVFIKIISFQHFLFLMNNFCIDF